MFLHNHLLDVRSFLLIVMSDRCYATWNPSLKTPNFQKDFLTTRENTLMYVLFFISRFCLRVLSSQYPSASRSRRALAPSILIHVLIILVEVDSCIFISCFSSELCSPGLVSGLDNDADCPLITVSPRAIKFRKPWAIREDAVLLWHLAVYARILFWLIYICIIGHPLSAQEQVVFKFRRDVGADSFSRSPFTIRPSG